MGRGRQLNALLVEIMFAVLFFGLASTVILDTYLATRKVSDKAGVLTDVLCEAQNLADQIYLAEDDAALTALMGAPVEDNGWTLNAANGAVMNVKVNTEVTDAGVFRKAVIEVEYNGETLLTLPCSRYLPGEEGAGE